MVTKLVTETIRRTQARRTREKDAVMVAKLSLRFVGCFFFEKFYFARLYKRGTGGGGGGGMGNVHKTRDYIIA